MSEGGETIVTEEELRQLVRESIARHVTGSAAAGPAIGRQMDAGRAAFALFQLARTDGGECLIEPAVRCTHCGFCQTYGH